MASLQTGRAISGSQMWDCIRCVRAHHACGSCSPRGETQSTIMCLLLGGAPSKLMRLKSKDCTLPLSSDRSGSCAVPLSQRLQQRTSKGRRHACRSARPPRPNQWKAIKQQAACTQVFKATKSGVILETFGREWQPGSDNHTFCKPTDVAVLSDGTAFVSDGYCNSRVVSLPRNRKPGDPMLVTQLHGKHTPSAPPLQHSVAVDGCRRQVEVGDREVGAVHRLLMAEVDKAGRAAEGNGPRLEVQSAIEYRLSVARRAFGNDVRFWGSRTRWCWP
jgi:hypothetical protein